MIPQGPFKSMVVLGESTVEGGGWLVGPEERWPDIRVMATREHAHAVDAG